MKTSFKDYKYTFIHLKDRILAISTYAGRTVKGSAKCAPGDTFDPSVGESIAAARCNVKVSKRRVRNAERKLKEALQLQYEANARVAKMQEYLVDSQASVITAENELAELIKEV